MKKVTLVADNENDNFAIFLFLMIHSSYISIKY